MKPIVDGLEHEYAGQVTIVRLDIDDPETAEAKAVHQFRYQPTYVLLDTKGEVVDRWLGRQDKGTFDAAFTAVLGQ
jgi:thioredoxin-like negative regulator of GroEL